MNLRWQDAKQRCGWGFPQSTEVWLGDDVEQLLALAEQLPEQGVIFHRVSVLHPSGCATGATKLRSHSTGGIRETMSLSRRARAGSSRDRAHSLSVPSLPLRSSFPNTSSDFAHPFYEYEASTLVVRRSGAGVDRAECFLQTFESGRSIGSLRRNF